MIGWTVLVVRPEQGGGVGAEDPRKEELLVLLGEEKHQSLVGVFDEHVVAVVADAAAMLKKRLLAESLWEGAGAVVVAVPVAVFGWTQELLLEQGRQTRPLVQAVKRKTKKIVLPYFSFCPCLLI